MKLTQNIEVIEDPLTMGETTYILCIKISALEKLSPFRFILKTVNKWYLGLNFGWKADVDVHFIENADDYRFSYLSDPDDVIDALKALDLLLQNLK